MGCQILLVIYFSFLSAVFPFYGWASSKETINSPTKTVLFLGDSLTEGYGVKKDAAYPDRVQSLFKSQLKKEIKVVNAGVSGSTSASGLTRLKWYFNKQTPHLIVLALGANDGLRGLNLDKSKAHLKEIIDFAQSKNVKIVLAGMLMPPNYGSEFREKFTQMYKTLSKEENVPLITFLLKGVAAKKEMNLNDGIHPNEKGHKVIAETVFNTTKDLL